MKIQGFFLAVLVLAPVCSADVAEFFDKLFGVFKPEGITVTDAPDNATGSASNDTTTVETATRTVLSGFDNGTEVVTGKLTSILVESLTESEEATTTEVTTDQDTTISSTTPTTTTVVYKLFHPNTTTTDSTTTTTTTTASAVTTSSTEVTGSTKDQLTESPGNATAISTTASPTNSTVLSTAATVAASNMGNTSLTESTQDTTATSTTPTAPESRIGALTSSLASTAIVNDVLCKTTYDPVANLKVTTCGDSTTPKAHSKRSAEYVGEAFPLADTIQNVNFPDNSYPSSSEIGDDDGDVFSSNGYGEYETAPINTYG